MNYKKTLYSSYTASFTIAIISNLAPIFFVIFREDYGLTFEQVGRLTLFNFATQVLADYLTTCFADRIGIRRMLVACHAFSAVGLIGLSVFPMLFPNTPYAAILAAVVIYAMGGGIIEVLVSPVVDALPGDAKASAMSLLHSFYCWGQMAVVLLTTLLLKVLGHQYWQVIPILWAIIPLINMFNFMKVPMPPMTSGEDRTSPKKLFSSKIFLVTMLIMTCAGASEIAMGQWASLFAEKGLGVSKLLGDLLGPCLFAVFMGIGRVIYGIWGEKIDLNKAIAVSCFFCILCYLTAVFSPFPVLALFGCALCGLSVALMWPGMLSITSGRFPLGGARMFGILALCGDAGCSLGPWLTGVISDAAQKNQFLINTFGTNLSAEQVGLKTGLLMGAIFPTILAICLFFTIKWQKEELKHEK